MAAQSLIHEEKVVEIFMSYTCCALGLGFCSWWGTKNKLKLGVK
jgi:hypothetical protein